jgi:hypothetical protein
VETPALGETGWYAIRFQNRTLTSGQWQARVSLLPDSDDFGNTLEESYPMVMNGGRLEGTLIAGDVDLFHVDVPAAGGGIRINNSGTFPMRVFDPAGVEVGQAVGTYNGFVGQAGRWTWSIEGGTGSYATTVEVDCGGSACEHTTARRVRYGWGACLTC